MSVSDSHLPMRTWPAIARAAAGKCPACGRAKFFRSYLHPVENCSYCDEHLGKNSCDDAPAWLTIIIVGHLVVPSAFCRGQRRSSLRDLGNEGSWLRMKRPEEQYSWFGGSAKGNMVQRTRRCLCVACHPSFSLLERIPRGIVRQRVAA
jgi:hypothetical protein